MVEGIYEHAIPLQLYGSDPRGDPDEIAARILSLIPSTENNPDADHYKQSANQGITTLVAALQAAGLSYNFIDFTILLMDHKAIEELETKLKKTVPNDPATKNLSLFLDVHTIADLALAKGIWLAPGEFFFLYKPDRRCFRFNVAHSNVQEISAFFASL